MDIYYVLYTIWKLGISARYIPTVFTLSAHYIPIYIFLFTLFLFTFLLKDDSFVSHSKWLLPVDTIWPALLSYSHITSNYGPESSQAGLLSRWDESTQARFICDKVKQGNQAEPYLLSDG